MGAAVVTILRTRREWNSDFAMTLSLLIGAILQIISEIISFYFEQAGDIGHHPTAYEAHIGGILIGSLIAVVAPLIDAEREA